MHRNSKVVLILSFCLITTAVLAAGRCVPCKLNHYCVDGFRYQCPSTAPVTQSTGAGALDECLTCTQRNGNSANPIYDDLVGDCVSCYEYDSSTPYWNGTACSACPDNTDWDEEELACKELEYTCAFRIPHGDGKLCLVEVASAVTEQKPANELYTEADTTYGYIASSDEDEAFLAKYGIVNKFPYNDYWAGAMKYCQDKGYRLPSMDEMVSIVNAIYGKNYVCEEVCNDTYSNETGCCDYADDNIAIVNQELYSWIDGGDQFVLWSNVEKTDGVFVWSYRFYHNGVHILPTGSLDGDAREEGGNHALCVR